MMKKIKQAAALLLTVAMLLTFSSCSGKPKGTYTSGGFVSQTFTFDGDNVTMSAFGINVTGKYKISNGNITITYSMFGTEYDWTQSYSKSGNTINIGGTDFTKK